MIRFENGMLALDYPMTKEHAQVIKDFVQYIKEQEQERIIKLLEEASISFEKFDFDSVATTNFLIRLIKGETSE